jgi:mannose-6-phosphate isomerase-like protein (cupin superfamily)
MFWQMNTQYMAHMIMLKEGVHPMVKKENENTLMTKSWGYELWFANTANYCGKLLVVSHGKWSSKGNFHYHKIKDETFFVIEGALTLDIAREGPECERITLYTNDSYRVMPGVKHRFTSAMPIPCKFIEASTHHDEEDSYRCYFNKEKGEWIHV